MNFSPCLPHLTRRLPRLLWLSLLAFIVVGIVSPATSGLAASVNTQVVTHDLNGAISAQSTSTTTAAPVILSQPLGLLAQTGANVSFSVKVSGTPTLIFQWKFNGANISTATNATAATNTLVVSNLTSTSFGSYSVSITNSASTITSQSALLQLDSVGDGIPDSWKAQYFGANWATTANTSADADFDGDGVSNLDEYLDGTNPALATSHFYQLTVAGAVPVTVQPQGTRFAAGTVVTLTAPLLGVQQFGGWTGTVSSLSNPLTLTMNENYQETPMYGNLPLDNSVPSFTQTGDTTVVSVLAMQSDGKVIVTGSFQAEDGVAHYGMARLNVDGSLDNTFGPAVTLGQQGIGSQVSQIPGSVNVAAIQADGKILVAGDFNDVDFVSYSPYIVRLNADGSLDTSFYCHLPQYSMVNQIIVRASDEKILVAGGFANGIIQLNTDGSVDTSFTSGLPSNTTVTFLARQTDNKVIYGGPEILGRLNTNGSLDTTYTPAVTPGYLAAFGLRSDGKLYVVSTGNLGSDLDVQVSAVLLGSTGAIDPSFTETTGLSFDGPQHLVILPDNGFVVDGNVEVQSGNSDESDALARFSATGTFATGLFTGLNVQGYNFPLALDSTGALLVGGNFISLGGQEHLNLARVSLSSGSVDGTYTPSFSSLSSVGGIAALPDGSAIVWGEFNVVNGYYRPYVARMGPPGYVDLSFNGGDGPDAPVRAAVVQPNGGVIIGGDFSTVDDQPFHNVARFKSDGTLDTGFVASGYFDGAEPVQVLAMQTDGKILVGGNFTTIGGVSYPYIARLYANGTVDGDFTPQPNSSVQAIVVQTDGKILIGGNFTEINGNAATGLARLNPDGGLDTTFNPPDLSYLLTGAVRSLALQPDGQIVVGGTFDTNNLSINSVPGAGLIRLNADGSADAAFNTTFAGLLDLPAYVEINDLTVQQDGSIIVVGGFSVNNVPNLGGAIRINSHGVLDTTTFSFGAADQPVNAVALLANGGVMLGGSFAQFEGNYRLAYTRLVTTNNIVPGTLTATLGGGGATLSLTPQSTLAPVLDVAIEQSSDGLNYTFLGYASAGANGAWTYVVASLPTSVIYYRANVSDTAEEQAYSDAAGPFAKAPEVTSSPSAAGYVGSAFNYVATANGSPTAFTATGLPTWATATFSASSGTLTISGTPTAEGTTLVTLHPANGVATGTASLKITIFDQYAQWAAANFTAAELQKPAVSGPLGDATGAGIKNLVKYALGIPPKQAGVAGLPTIGTIQEGASKYLTLTYTFDPLAAGVTLTVQSCTNLSLNNWNSGPGNTTEISRTDNVNGTETVVTRGDTPIFGSPSAEFMRLQVSQ